VGRGTVTALSLSAVLLREYGDTIFAGRGGIQVLQKIKSSRIVEVPAEKLLADEGRLDRAVRLVVDSIRVRLRPKA
jgi:hypothetical protein